MHRTAWIQLDPTPAITKTFPQSCCTTSPYELPNLPLSKNVCWIVKSCSVLARLESVLEDLFDIFNPNGHESLHFIALMNILQVWKNLFSVRSRNAHTPASIDKIFFNYWCACFVLQMFFQFAQFVLFFRIQFSFCFVETISCQLLCTDG